MSEFSQRWMARKADLTTELLEEVADEARQFLASIDTAKTPEELEHIVNSHSAYLRTALDELGE